MLRLQPDGNNFIVSFMALVTRFLCKVEHFYHLVYERKLYLGIICFIFCQGSTSSAYMRRECVVDEYLKGLWVLFIVLERFLCSD